MKKLLVTLTMMAIVATMFASPRSDLRWIYEKAFGSDAIAIADINADMLKRSPQA